MGGTNEQDVFIDLTGQDDNLGDSALRQAYLRAVRHERRRMHVYFDAPTGDYLSGFELTERDTIYTRRPDWLRASEKSRNPVHLLNAGEIDPQAGSFPNPRKSVELRYAAATGATLIAAGLGFKDPAASQSLRFSAPFRQAALVSWRDSASRDTAGFGEVAPDWAYSLGTDTQEWIPSDSRDLLAVTMRFDRPWPAPAWIEGVRGAAREWGVRVVTLAQVARDAPRAVRLAEALGGEYRLPPSMLHADLDAYAREIFQQSLAVVSDRAHGLIIGATEGAVPIGSAANAQKIHRLLAEADLGELVGRYEQLPAFVGQLAERRAALAPAVDRARVRVAELTRRINEIMDRGAPQA
ncbi:hypothetical protein [Nesterenkonia flava]|uniref:Polysaccharide pyruvyl transferase domain-containing protein n=1 Tax=Nesterenkonia flava TaxID=469799 RepID=A0ABU1FSQ1_9MICC|nr:hypothetical protein [Nesterenkonia flava]MDR5711690.1 hypothetical protein [Nesterenkonia flava]